MNICTYCYESFDTIILRVCNLLHFVIFIRAIWYPIPGSAWLCARGNVTLRARPPNGSSLPGSSPKAAHGHEASCNVPGRPLLKLKHQSPIGLVIQPFSHVMVCLRSQIIKHNCNSICLVREMEKALVYAWNFEFCIVFYLDLYMLPIL